MSEVIFDFEEVMERVQEDTELLLELFDLFFDDFKEKRKALDGYLESSDFDGITGVAHSLKGASGNISAKALREVLIQLEEEGNHKILDGIPNILIELDKRFEELQNHLEGVKEKLKS